MSSAFVASQSSCFFLCSREQIRLVENRLNGRLYLFMQADKVVQMYETMLTRHTTMIVGPTGGGKSVVINTLAQAQTR